ncbi:MAG: DUF2194 domain-containing protein [Lachnospiraceae bacterium]|nr:DUF2194 domain-containing protein [Lachnospiraceae bacterium]
MRKFKSNFISIAGVVAVFAALVIALLGQNSWKVQNQTVRLVSLIGEEEAASFTAAATENAQEEPDCLYVWQSEDGNSVLLHEQMPQILTDMKVDYLEVDADTQEVPELEAFDTLVLGVATFDDLYWLEDLRTWVSDGGKLLLALVPEYSPAALWLYQVAGVQSMGAEYYETPGVRFVDDTMLYGEKTDYYLAESFESSYVVTLEADCTVHLVTCDEAETPLLWERTLGKGKAVVVNLGIYDKAYRGFYSSAYSYLDDTSIWPVINASVWYLDDFPSPVPGGESSYIERDYNMDISTFYTQVWWEDIRSLTEEYGIRYTGLVIEEYSDQIEGPFSTNTGTSRFQYFGNMLLSSGGEIGLHGYNHMPLVLDDSIYTKEYDSYKAWASYDDMKAGIAELVSFCESLYPTETFSVYVPPSNILSAEGREMLSSEFGNIRAIASIYLADGEDGDGLEYEQEFEVAADGIVETPRVISGYLMGEYTELAALSELNFHYISSHFQHPDDVMDEDRGAELGWETMFSNLTDYVDWLYTAAPELRRLTGSEVAGAVQRFYYLDVERVQREDGLEISLENFYDEAWLMLRFNAWEPGEVTGGELTQLTGNLYLLKATAASVFVEKRVSE